MTKEEEPLSAADRILADQREEPLREALRRAKEKERQENSRSLGGH